MKYNKNADTLLFLLLFTKSQREKNIQKTLFVSAGARKRWSSGSTLPQYLPTPKTKFPVKFIFTLKYIVLLSNDKNAKTISLKVFKKMNFKNLQQ